MHFSEYNSCIDFLFSLERVGIKYDLNNIESLCKHLGNPQLKFKSIHIAGTNGKGTVASVLNSIFMEGGYKCGLYTSPHIIDFRERILINGKQIDKQYIIDFTNSVLKQIEKLVPSFFEVTTALAFKYFAEKKVDFAFIEAGLGGRLDSTNIIKPEISIITSISIDHTEYLGDTIEKIAFEKGGIIAENVPVITGKIPDEAMKVIKTQANISDAELINSDKYAKFHNRRIIEKGIGFSIDTKNLKYKSLEFPLNGNYQYNNIATAFSALDKLIEAKKADIQENAVRKGLLNIKKNSGFFGRFDVIHNYPTVVIDVSHNAEGIANLESNLSQLVYNNLYIIFGMMKDKEQELCIRLIEKLEGIIFFTKPEYKRAEEPEVLFSKSRQIEKAFITENVIAAKKAAFKKAKPGDLILVTGSFYVVSDFLMCFDSED